VITESDLHGNWTAVYGLIRGQLASRVDIPGNVVHYYFHDQLSSTNVVTDALGNIQNESDYYPYGGEIVVSSGDSNRYKFTGKERDSESGLDNFGKRYYASSMGRFSSTDPGPYVWHDPQTLNRYAYTRNNPLKYVDPTGMYFVVAAEMQAQVKQYISTMLRSPQGAAMIRAISANPKPNFFSQGTLDRHQVPGTNQIAITNGTTTAIAGNQPGQVAGTQTVLSNSNIAFTAGFSTGAMAGDIFAVGLKAFAHEDAHVVDINAAHTLQGAAAAGAAGDAPTQPGAENTAGGTAEGRALGVMGELGDAGQGFQPNAQTDAQADAIIQGGMQQFGQDQAQQINQAVQHHGCTSDSEGQHCD
jgi:RHS repeat-associated protein